MQETPLLLKTALYNHHCALGALMQPFAGWDMPLYYQNSLEEHRVVRSSAGIFDVSHMGRIRVEGEDAERFIDWLGSNAIIGLGDGVAIYTVLCHSNGGSVDDTIILRHRRDFCSVIANASNRTKVFSYLSDEAARGWNVVIRPPLEGEGILALQGPKALAMASLLMGDLVPKKVMTLCSTQDLVVARTGYTGEEGVELFTSKERLIELWEKSLQLGAKPIGLAARDTLRMEKGYALYGHELSDTIAPTESVAVWTMRWNRPSFIAKEALAALENSPKKRTQYLVQLEEGIARTGTRVFCEGEEVGIVTSGTFSPSLKKGLSIVMIRHKLPMGATLDLEVRGALHSAKRIK